MVHMQHGETQHASASPSALLETLRSLRDLIESSARADEESTELGGQVLAALEEAGLFNVMAPRDVGGLEADPLKVFEILKLLSYYDGSTGWYSQAATTGVAVVGAFLGERAIDAIFCSGERATCAGQAAPTGKAERSSDGYRISGSFSFGSGLPSASWVIGGYILYEDGRPRLRENGDPIMLIAAAPRSKVELCGNWRVLGLRGTGSYDFRVPEQIVHEDFVFDPATASPRRGGALYRMGFFAIPTLCHAAFGAGCGQRILDEWMNYAHGKQRGTIRLGETDVFRKEFAVAHSAMSSAEAYVRTTYKDLFAAAERAEIPARLTIDSRLCASNMLATGTRIAQAAFTSSATTGLRNGSLLQRCFRDMQAGNAHFLTGEQSFVDAGRELYALRAAKQD